MQKVRNAGFKSIGLFILLVSSFVSMSQDYAVSNIPKELKANAKAVVRQYDVNLYLNSVNRLKMEVKYAITILNENGLDNSQFNQPYYKFSRVKDIKGIIFDEYGNKIRKIKSEDIQDYSNISGFSIYEDNRTKYIDPEHRTTPFTVEYTYNIVYDGILDYPDFYLFDDYNISVQNASFKIISEPDINFRTKEINISPENCNTDNQTSNSWTFKNIKAIRQESFSMPIIELIPNIQIAPNEFKIGDYSGNSKTWENFGKWEYLLIEGRNELEDETVQNIRNLVKDTETEYDKVKLIFEYMQNKTRYVSIQIGIGGWQPIDAKTVDKLSYGDCKALSNYTKSLLDAVDIKSYYTGINAGWDATPMMEEFPSNQFNHVILCVPNEGDTLWLECTDQNTPFAYTGAFTNDRKALLITEDGGKVVSTKTIPAKGNLQSRRIEVALDRDGNGKAIVNTTYSGLYYDYMNPILVMDDKEKRNSLLKRIKVPNFDLLNYTLDENRSRNPFISESVELNLNNYCTIIGDKILVRTNLMTFNGALPYENHTRKSEINIRWPYTQSDTITYTLPPNYIVDNIPKEKSITATYGEYQRVVTIDGNKLQYIRNFKLNKGIYPAEEYYDFFEFFENIANADGCKFSMVQKSEETSLD